VRIPRPVAELALDPLLEAAPELARRWAIALLGAVAPDSLGAVSFEDLARDAPGLIGAVLAALGSDEELARLLGEVPAGESSPAARIPAIAGAGDGGAVVAAVEALRGVLLDALVDRFIGAAPDPARARQLSELGDRLAHVCAALLPVALAEVAAPGVWIGAAPAEAVPVDAPGAPGAPRPGSAAISPRPATAPGATRAAGGRVVIIDELAPPAASVEAPEAEPAPESELEPARRDEAQDALVDPFASAEIEIRDERGDEGPAAWIRSIGRRLELFEKDGAVFAVLLVELRGPGFELAGEALERQLGEALPPEASVTREWAGRYWVVVPGADRLRAGELASQLTRSLEAALPRGRQGSSIAVGTAVCPEDGRRAAALAAHADVGLYAARSERRSPVRVEVPPGP